MVSEAFSRKMLQTSTNSIQFLFGNHSRVIICFFLPHNDSLCLHSLTTVWTPFLNLKLWHPDIYAGISYNHILNRHLPWRLTAAIPISHVAFTIKITVAQAQDYSQPPHNAQACFVTAVQQFIRVIFKRNFMCKLLVYHHLNLCGPSSYK
jgi:hypothetical protein